MPPPKSSDLVGFVPDLRNFDQLLFHFFPFLHCFGWRRIRTNIQLNFIILSKYLFLPQNRLIVILRRFLSCCTILKLQYAKMTNGKITVRNLRTQKRAAWKIFQELSASQTGRKTLNSAKYFQKNMLRYQFE